MEIKHIFMLTLSVVTIVLLIIFIFYHETLKAINKKNKIIYKYSKISTIFAVIIILLSLINFGLSIFNIVTANDDGSIEFFSVMAAAFSGLFVIFGVYIIYNNYDNKKNDKL